MTDAEIVIKWFEDNLSSAKGLVELSEEIEAKISDWRKTLDVMNKELHELPVYDREITLEEKDIAAKYVEVLQQIPAYDWTYDDRLTV